MGRITPLDDDPAIHPALSLSLMVAATAAIIAIITSLCGLCGKPAPELTSSDADKEKSSESDAPPQQEPTATATATASTVVETEDEPKVLPPPPCMEAGATTRPSDRLMKKSASSRKVSSVLSMKNLRSASVRDVIEKNRPHLHNKHEDSLWKKKIILGDKCRVSYDPYKDDEDDKLSDFSISLKNTDAVAVDVDKDKGMTRKEEEEEDF